MICIIYARNPNADLFEIHKIFQKKAQHCNHFLIFNMWYVTLKCIISLPLKMQKSMLCNSKQFETKSMHYIFLDFFLRHCFQGNWQILFEKKSVKIPYCLAYDESVFWSSDLKGCKARERLLFNRAVGTGGYRGVSTSPPSF